MHWKICYECEISEREREGTLVSILPDEPLSFLAKRRIIFLCQEWKVSLVPKKGHVAKIDNLVDITPHRMSIGEKEKVENIVEPFVQCRFSS